MYNENIKDLEFCEKNMTLVPRAFPPTSPDVFGMILARFCHGYVWHDIGDFVPKWLKIGSLSTPGALDPTVGQDLFRRSQF